MTWLNKLYHVKAEQKPEGNVLDGVDLSTPLAYADRFRIRHPGVQWNAHPPHIDGGGIERWVSILHAESYQLIEYYFQEESNFRSCYKEILNGDWKKHDPYDLTARLNAKLSLYGRPNQV